MYEYLTKFSSKNFQHIQFGYELTLCSNKTAVCNSVQTKFQVNNFIT